MTIGARPGFKADANPSATDAWKSQAICDPTDPDKFFPSNGKGTLKATEVCKGCQVKDQCLEYAYEHDERFGVWGGEGQTARREELARRKKALARKQKVLAQATSLNAA